jgi:S1-C subfamily serine protease
MNPINSVVDGAIVNLTMAMIDTSNNIFTEVATGFFIDQTHVVTVAHAILTPAPRVPASTYYLTRVQRIIGTVNYNNEGYASDFKLIGLSPINDVAVLEATGTLPPHTFLKFGDTYTTPPGTVLYVIGDLLNRDIRAISSGILRDNRMTYQGSPILPELVDANISIGGGVSGSPIFTADGTVVGLVSFTLNWLQTEGYLISTGTTAGPVTSTIKMVVDDILAGKNVHTVTDVFGNWLHWQMPGLNATFNYVQPVSLLTAINGISTAALNAPLPQTTNEGVFVTSIDDGSPLSGYLSVGDMIVAINGITVGYESSSQSSIGEILKSLTIGSNVTLTIKTSASNYSATGSVSVTLQPLSHKYDIIYNDAQTLSTSYVTRVAYKLGSANASATATIVNSSSTANS